MPEALRERLREPFLRTSLRTRAAAMLSIMWLMVVKPRLLDSLLILVSSTAIGLLPGLLVREHARVEGAAVRATE